MLRAPRYSHIRETISNHSAALANAPGSSTLSTDHLSDSASTSADESDRRDATAKPTSTAGDSSVPSITELPSPGLRSRVKTYVMSYLPILSRRQSEAASPSRVDDKRPGLPLPPPELLEKSRAPIHTPVSKPIPKPTHPRSLVTLNARPSRIPRLQIKPKEQPKRLVDLRPVSPPIERSPSLRSLRARRSSGCSVKELVQSFEEMESERSMEMDNERLRSSGTTRPIRAL